MICFFCMKLMKTCAKQQIPKNKNVILFYGKYQQFLKTIVSVISVSRSATRNQYSNLYFYVPD